MKSKTVLFITIATILVVLGMLFARSMYELSHFVLFDPNED